MAKHPDYSPEQPFTPEQLAEIRWNFAMLSTSSLRTAYTEALERCRLTCDGRPPKAEQMQELVQAWRQLRKGVEVKLLGPTSNLACEFLSRF